MTLVFCFLFLISLTTHTNAIIRDLNAKIYDFKSKNDDCGDFVWKNGIIFYVTIFIFLTNIYINSTMLAK